MRIIEDDFDSLVQRFGATRRFVTRVGALARKGLFLSESIVEFACEADGKPLVDFVLSRLLLDEALELDTKQLKAHTTKADKSFFAEHPLALSKQHGKRVLCLAEETESEVEVSDPGKALSAAGQGGIAALIGAPEAAKLLGADEISRLKLDLLTSSELGKRLEAVRKLWLAKLPAHDKLQLFLAALRDKEADVRAEAARALGALGLDLGLTENVAKASAGSLPERVVAIANLVQIMPRLDASQQKLALGVASGFVRAGEPKEVVQAALGLLAKQLGEARDLGEFLPALHKQLVELAQVQQSQYEEAIRSVYAASYALDRTLTTRLLVATVEESAQSALQFFALSLICRFDLDGAAEPRVVAKLVDGVQTGSELDGNYQACVGALSTLRERAIDALVEALPGSTDTGQLRIVGLLGNMMRSEGLSAEAGRKAALACLKLHPSAAASVRVALLESGFYEHDYLEESERRVAAELFIADLHTFRFERQIELIQTALRRCGRAAIGPLTQGIVESTHDVTRLTSATLLPDVIAHDAKVSRKELERLLHALRKLIENDDSTFPTRGPLYIALARIAAHVNVPSEAAGEVGRLLRQHVGKSSDVYDVIDALGYLAAGASLEASERVEIGHLLLSFLKRSLPTVGGSLKKNAQGEDVLEFGRETTAYTELIPRVLEGLGRVMDAKATPKGLYSRVLADLGQLWRDVTDYKMIWAPASVITLGRLLGQVAVSGRESERAVEDIAEALARRTYLLPIMQVLGRVAAVHQASVRLDVILAKVMQELVRRLTAEQEPETIERRQILETMFQIASRKSIGEKPTDADHVRRGVVEALFDAMKDKFFTQQAWTWLEQLASNKHVSENMRGDIKRRLKPLGERR